MSRRYKQSERGIASIEAVAMVTVFVILMAYGIGMFGVIHTGILNSIAARTYAWETFNHRTNINLFRDNRNNEVADEHYYDFGFRVHSIASERSTSEYWIVTERMVAMGRDTEVMGRDTASHQRLNELTKRERWSVNPVWIKTLYGICLNSTCGTVNL